MARPTRPTKTEEVKTTAGYFNKSDVGGIKVYAAALSIANDLHVLIGGNNIENLKKAWAILTPNTPFNPKLAPAVLFKWDDQYIEEKKDKTVVVMPRPEAHWYFHAESDCCFVDVAAYQPVNDEVVDLGVATLVTVTECKLILRKLGWSRHDIENVTINNDYIPF